MVVLRRHEQHGIVSLEVSAKANGLGQLRGLHRRGHLLREEREFVVAQIEEHGLHALNLTSLVLDPANNLLAGSAGTNGTKDDCNGSHNVSFRSIIETSTTIDRGKARDKNNRYRLGHKSHSVTAMRVL